MISILKLADEESCMYLKCLAGYRYVHTYTAGTSCVRSYYIVYLCTMSG